MKRHNNPLHRSSKNPSLVKDKKSGSPDMSGGPVFLAVGKLRRPHGISGEIMMEVITDFPERIKPGSDYFIGESYQPANLIGVRWHGEALLMLFEGYDNPESVGELRNLFVYRRTENIPKLPKGHYYIHQLIGMDVVNLEGILLGKVSEVIQTGANDVYVVNSPDGVETLLPVIEGVILEIDEQKKQITANPQTWL